MAETQVTIRRRIRSVNNTLQITKAMELVATSKLQRQKNRMLEGKVYADTLYEIISKAFGALDETKAESISPYLVKRDFDRPLVIVFGSDDGMCGSYNSNLDKFVRENVGPNDRVFVCGKKQIRTFEREGREYFRSFANFSRFEAVNIRKIADQALQMYELGEISEIRIIYTEYVNAATFEPTVKRLLPVDRSEFRGEETEILFEPDPTNIVDKLIPMYVRNVMYSLVLRARTSEYASRRLAMETATDNANELKEELTLSYNKARQAAITQEINEISVNGMSRE